MYTHIVQIGPDEEVLEKLGKAVEVLNVGCGPITLTGAVRECAVSVIAHNDPTVDYLREYDQPLELVGTGEVADGKVYVHATLAGEGLLVAGRLHRAVVRDHLVRAYVTAIDSDLPVE